LGEGSKASSLSIHDPKLEAKILTKVPPKASTKVLVTFAGHVGTITLNNAEKHNAFDDVLIAEISAAIQECNRSMSTRVIVLAAAGKSFSAGADLNWMQRMADYTQEENEEDAMGLAALMGALHGTRKPTIARVQGAAFGGGVGLVACCDMAVGTVNAAFCLSETKLGLVPAVISPYVIAAIGERAAHRYFLTAEKFSAAEAHRIGLLHEVVADEVALDAKIAELAAALCLAGPKALEDAKKLIAMVAHQPIDETLQSETAEFIARIRGSREGREGVTAFLEKRKPSWLE
jgi:methylglutaconyl-CoA hydratase